MVFSSPIFLTLFLPIVLSLYPAFRGIGARNLWLLAVSIVFYAWGEPVFVLLMLGSTLMNYALGRWVDGESEPMRRKWVVAFSVTLNLGLLAFFKYANFVVGNLDVLLGWLDRPPIHLQPIRLPIGISFFTFHALSYVIDIYRRKGRATRKPSDVALYIFFFPQLIAGPIMRWSAIAPQLANRVVTRDKLWEGARRFVYGLAKKMLVANALAVPAGQIFSLPSGSVSPMLAWFGALCYALQIYFDFSGYSDMAIGLGKMFGFEFMENFNHPYIAQSIRDFWQRWHISLSTWFRDYLYIPLGGNRCSSLRNHLNLLIVFFFCGLWHGASWTFVVWGLYHGLFLILERTRFGSWIASLPEALRRIYTLVVVMLGWVFFRAESLPQAAAFLGAMFGLTRAPAGNGMLAPILTHQVACAVLMGVIFSTPFGAWFNREIHRLSPNRLRPGLQLAGILIEPLLLMALLITSAAWLANETYNPFIYFRF
jgi:alginate O-acetyltransferase complex protein AlgI